MRSVALALAAAAFVFPNSAEPVAASTTTPGEPSVEVALVELRDSVSVTFWVRASDSPLAVAYCHEAPAGALQTCVGGFEIQKAGRWSALQFRLPGRVLGYLSRDHWKVRAVPPHAAVQFRMAFDKRDFAAARGDTLRVWIEAWADEEAMAVGDSPIRLISSPFTCP